MQRREFLGAVVGGLGGIALPSGVTQSSIEVVTDPETIDRIRGKELHLYDAERYPEVEGLLRRSFFGAATEDLMELSEKDYSRWLRAHLRVNRSYGVASRVQQKVFGKVFAK